MKDWSKGHPVLTGSAVLMVETKTLRSISAAPHLAILQLSGSVAFLLFSDMFAFGAQDPAHSPVSVPDRESGANKQHEQDQARTVVGCQDI